MGRGGGFVLLDGEEGEASRVVLLYDERCVVAEFRPTGWTYERNGDSVTTGGGGCDDDDSVYAKNDGLVP